MGRQPAAGAPVGRGCARPPAASSNGVDRLSWTQGAYLYTAELLVTARVVSFIMQQPEAATFSRGWAIKLCLWQHTRCDRPFRVDSSCACSHLLIVLFVCWQVASRLGVPAGPLLDSRWTTFARQMGFDILTYKTIRTQASKGGCQRHFVCAPAASPCPAATAPCISSYLLPDSPQNSAVQ